MACIDIMFIISVLITIRSMSMGNREKKLLLSDPTYLQNEIDNLKSQLQAQQNRIQVLESQGNFQGKGDIFIHWGKGTCNNATSTLIYTGYTAGSQLADPGSSAKSICLPNDPIFLQNEIDASLPYFGYIYGTEYEFNGMSQTSLRNDDVPCAVCMSQPGTRILTVPARNRCYDGWTEIYNGFLVGNYYKHAAAFDYICVDRDPDRIVGGGSDLPGRLLYLQKTKCGSLECPPYVDDKTVLCVVCSI